MSSKPAALTRRSISGYVCCQSMQGRFLGIPGHGRRVSFRMLHLWEFCDGRISRENLWLDGGTAAAQLAQP